MCIRFAVIGGGITGLAAAVRLADRAPVNTEITVFEQSDAIGGKVRSGVLGGVTVERGAEAFLVGGSDGDESPAMRLARRVGLGDALVHPATVPAAIAVDGRLEPLPSGTLLGVPGDVSRLAPLVSVPTDADPDEGRPLLPDHSDVAVGELVRRRFGDQVVERLVDPMLGGVYAGRADALSLAATVPSLAAAARREHTLAGAVRAAQAATPRIPGRPFFATIAGGMIRLAEAAAKASGATVRLSSPVHELSRTPSGWRLTAGPASDPVIVDVDAVILAVPAGAAARLLAGVDAGAAAAVGVLGYAGVGLVGFALPPGTSLPALSGFLVPAGSGLLVKAATFFTRKWPHLRAEGAPVIVRASLARAGEEHSLRQDDAALVGIAHAELGHLLGAPLPAPLGSWVQRWEASLPQYAPGHVDRVVTARAALRAAPTLALAGAAYDGVGIPACVRSGEVAAQDVLISLRRP